MEHALFGGWGDLLHSVTVTDYTQCTFGLLLPFSIYEDCGTERDLILRTWNRVQAFNYAISQLKPCPESLCLYISAMPDTLWLVSTQSSIEVASKIMGLHIHSIQRKGGQENCKGFSSQKLTSILCHRLGSIIDRRASCPFDDIFLTPPIPLRTCQAVTGILRNEWSIW